MNGNQENRPEWELAKERVRAKWPDAIVCGDIEGGTRIWTDKGSRRLGHSDIPLYQMRSAEEAWVVADRNLAASDVVKPDLLRDAVEALRDARQYCAGYGTRSSDELAIDIDAILARYDALPAPLSAPKGDSHE